MLKKISSLVIILSLLAFGVTDVVDAKRGGGGKKSHSSHKTSTSKKKSVSKPSSTQSKPKTNQSVKQKSENQQNNNNIKNEPKPQTQVLPKVLYIATDIGYVFTSPYSKSKAISSLPKGTVLTPKAKTGEWFQVNFTQNNQVLTGYVSSSIISTSFIPLNQKPQVIQTPTENVNKPPVSKEVQERILNGYIEMFKAEKSTVELVVGENGTTAYGHPNDRNSAVFAKIKSGDILKSDYKFMGWYQVYVTIGNEVAIAYVDSKEAVVNSK